MLVGWMAGAYALGIVLVDRGWLSFDTSAVLLVQAVWLSMLCVRLPAARRPLTLVLCALAGAYAFASRTAAPPLAEPVETIVEGRVLESRSTARGQLVVLGGRVQGPGSALRGRLRIRTEGSDEHQAGDRLRARVRLRPPTHRFNPGSRDPAERLRRAGVGAVGHLVHPALRVRVAGEGGRGWRARFEERRARAAERLAGVGPAGPLVAALGLGWRSDLARSDADALRRLGLSHLLAVSGLHLGLAAALGYALALAVLRRSRLAARYDVRRAAWLVALLFASGYAIACGLGVPLQRAWICLLAVTASGSLRRVVRPAAPLCVAAFVVLVREPAALFAPGAQLSFAASAALVSARRRAGAVGVLAGAFALVETSATAIAATAPFAAVHFGTATPYGLFANLAAVPWVAFVLLPVCLIASAVALALPDWLVTGLVFEIAAQLAATTLWLVRAASDLVPPSLLAARAGPLGVALAAGIALLTLRAPALALRIGLVLVQALVLVFSPPARILPAPPRLVFLDVGQGDATLVQGRRGAVLIDGGAALPGRWDTGRSVVVPALRALGVERLDLIIASHADLDHRGGLPAVLGALPVGAVWIPAGSLRDPAFAELREAAQHHEVPVVSRGLGDGPYEAGDLRIVPLWPPPASGAPAGNDRSLAVRVDIAGARVLLPGDLEAAGERALIARAESALRADILKLPHHGSASSSTEALLAAVVPAVAVASAPCHGRFEMPARDVRARLAAVDATLWWTGRDGAVLVGLTPRPRVRGWGPAGGIGACD